MIIDTNLPQNYGKHERSLQVLIQRANARIYREQLKKEGLAHKLATDKGFIDQIYRDYESYDDPRARATMAKIIAECLRLGKREPASQIQAQQTTNNLSITMSEEQARAILRQLAGNSGHVADSSSGHPSEIIDIAPPVDNLARLKADIDAANAQNNADIEIKAE